MNPKTSNIAAGEKLTKPTPCRFHDSTKSRLKTVSRRFKLKPGQLIRLAVDAKLVEWERNGVVTVNAA